MNRLFETSSEELVDDGNNLYLCGMKKLLCPQCKIAAMYVKNEQGERLLVYVLENGEVVPKYPEDSMEGFDLTEVFCLCCSWHGSPKRLVKLLLEQARQWYFSFSGSAMDVAEGSEYPLRRSLGRGITVRCAVMWLSV